MTAAADTTLPPAVDDSRSARMKTLAESAVGTIAIALAVVILVGAVWVGGTFFSNSNIALIGSFVAIPIVVGTCSAFALLGGVVDLSIGSMVGFSATMFALLSSHHWNPLLAAVVCVVLGAICGAINAVAIVTFGADPIAATLGMLTVLRGLCTVINGNTGAITYLNAGFYAFTQRKIGPFPILFVIAVVLVVLATVVVAKTRLGRHVRAVGGDERAARRAGISVTRVRYGALIVSAVGASIGGVLYMGQLGGSSNLLGTGLEFQVYAALMIGGYSILRGGVGNPAGGVMGLLVVAGVSNLLDVKAINPYYTNLIVGVLLLTAVLLDRLRGGDSYE
jgi:ribose/xylose/arabinose/galactoside ABC-type transport system permease subunit